MDICISQYSIESSQLSVVPVRRGMGSRRGDSVCDKVARGDREGFRETKSAAASMANGTRLGPEASAWPCSDARTRRELTDARHD